MSEKKSFWNKPRKGPSALIAGFMVIACSIFVVVFALGLLSAKNNSIKNLLTFALLISIGISAALAVVFALGRWLFCWRNMRRTLFGLVCLATLLALFYAEENWRGKYTWEKYRREQEAEGEQFDLKSIAPQAVPDAQNFAMTPMWIEEICASMGPEKARKWYGDKVAALGHTNFVSKLRMPIELSGRGLESTNQSGGWTQGEKFDLRLWQEYYRKFAATTNFFPIAPQPQTPAADVLLALSKYDATIQELRAASQLPFSRFPLGYEEDNPAMIVLPHLSLFRQIALMLQLRAVAELELGQTEKALDDIKLILRLTKTIRNEPIFISHLVRMSVLQIGLQPVWQGLAEQRWSDAQLLTLETEFSQFDFLADYLFAIRSERIMSIGAIDFMKRSRDFEMLAYSGEDELWESGKVVSSILYRLAPSGWFEQNKISISRMNYEYLLPIVDMEKHVISLSTVAKAKKALEKLPPSPFTWFDRLFLPALGSIPPKFAYAESVTDMARIACALESYRLAHESFPETLAALTPKFLEKIPHDIINGQSLNYRLTTNGQFILYSVGWNGTDDGGSIVMGKGKTPGVDTKQGDWVWKYPAN
ncbi:MAG: hypothetical protein ABIR24_11245 [Verrucomicrobiota bacterium]